MIKEEDLLEDINSIDKAEKDRIYNEYKENQQKENSRSRKRLFLFIAFVFVLFKFVILNGFIPSGSMEPGLQINDSIIVNRLAYLTKDPERFDVIVFKDEGGYVIKRIIGVPGDEVALIDGYVYLNGNILEEDYVMKRGTTYARKVKNKRYTVPESSYFVLGDNRENSIDSRDWDNPYLSVDSIVGKLMFKYKLPKLEFFKIKR